MKGKSTVDLQGSVMKFRVFVLAVLVSSLSISVTPSWSEIDASFEPGSGVSFTDIFWVNIK
jgi:hypothetical protein